MIFSGQQLLLLASQPGHDGRSNPPTPTGPEWDQETRPHLKWWLNVCELMIHPISRFFSTTIVDELKDLLICMQHRSWTMAESGQTPCLSSCSFSPVAFLSKPIQIHKIAGSCRQLHILWLFASARSLVLGDGRGGGCAESPRAAARRASSRGAGATSAGAAWWTWSKDAHADGLGEETGQKGQEGNLAREGGDAFLPAWCSEGNELWRRIGWLMWILNLSLGLLVTTFYAFFSSNGFSSVLKISPDGFSLRWRRWIFALWWTWRLPCNGGWRQ